MTSEIFPARGVRTPFAGEFVSWPWRAIVLAGVIGLAVPTALVAIGEGFGTLALPFNLYVVDQRLPGIFKLHMLASGLALLILPAVIALRHRPRLHRPLGRVAAFAVGLGGLTSLPVALLSDSVGLARAGFLAQGLVWMGLLVWAIAAIRARRVGEHARLMLAMTAVASGAIWVRLTTAVAVKCDVPFDAVYGIVAWLGWLAPLALVWHFSGRLAQPGRPVSS